MRSTVQDFQSVIYLLKTLLMWRAGRCFLKDLFSAKRRMICQPVLHAETRNIRVILLLRIWMSTTVRTILWVWKVHMNKLAKKGFYKPFFVSTGVAIPRPAPRRNTWRTQPLFLFGWALFPTMPENCTQGGRMWVRIKSVSSALLGSVVLFEHYVWTKIRGRAIAGLLPYILIPCFVLVSFILSYHIHLS